MGLILPCSVTIFGALVTYYGWKIYQRRAIARAYGCQQPKKFRHIDPLLGLDLFLQAGKLFEENKYLPELVKRYNEYGRTFQTNLLGTPSINTIEPENLRIIYSTNFHHWGVQPVRLPAHEPFCGRGFLTTDGPAWEHGRSLLKPSFKKSNIADLSIFEKYVTKIIEHIPKDGSTIDLQPLLFNLVSLLLRLSCCAQSVD